MSACAKVWFHRIRALAWVLIGVASFWFGWADSVALVWAASVYANALTDWGAGEAADDRKVIGRLERMERMIADLQPKDPGGEPR